MTAVPPSDAPGKPLRERLLKLQDVAAHLQLSVRTIRRMIAGGRLPVVRLGRSIRVRRCDLEAFVASSGQEGSVDDKDSD
jgi:excisionase family DNA binding protein